MNKKFIVIAVAVLVVVIGGFAAANFFGSQKVVVDTSAQAQKIKEYANPDAFITPYQLKELMDNKKADVVVIGSLNPKKMAAPISGSFTMWRPDYSASEGVYPYGGMRNTDEQMETILSGFGATKKSTIVVYASGSHHDAARLWWQIKQLGHKDVRFLDGGLNAWAGAGYPTGDANPSVTKTGYKAPKAGDFKYADIDAVIAAIGDSDCVIIDTRTPGENDGSKVKGGAFGPGSIPSSVWINWTNANNEDTTLKSLSELKTIYGDLVEGKKVISFCQSGVRSAHTTMVLLNVLGAEDVFNYDGSWIEWSYNHYEQNGKVDIINGN